MIDPARDLDKRERLALRQALQSGSGAAPAKVVGKLERLGLAARSGHLYEAEEWGKVVRRWPVFWLTDEGRQIAQQIVDRLRAAPSAHATKKKSARQFDREIAVATARAAEQKLAAIARTRRPTEAETQEALRAYAAAASATRGDHEDDEGVFYLADASERPLGPEFASRLAAKRAAMKLVRDGDYPRVEVWHRWRGDRYMQGLASEEGWSDV